MTYVGFMLHLHVLILLLSHKTATIVNQGSFSLQMSMSLFLTADVDECEEDTDLCEYQQLCANNNGSYTCGCQSGQVKARDGHRCLGKVLLVYVLCERRRYFDTTPTM